MLSVSSDEHDQAGHDEGAVADAADVAHARADRRAEHHEIERGREHRRRRCSAPACATCAPSRSGRWRGSRRAFMGLRPHQADEDLLERALGGLQVLEVDAGVAQPPQQRRRCRCPRPGCRRCSQLARRRRRAPARSRRGPAAAPSAGAAGCSVSCLLPSLRISARLVLDQDQLALVDHPDPVGHLLGLLDVVGGEDDGDAASRAARAPSPTCRGAARRRRRRSARRGTGSAARATAPWRSSPAASCRRRAS